MQIRRPRSVTVPQLVFVTALGFVGGIYIWKPLIVKFKNSDSDKKSNSGLQTKAAVEPGPKTATTFFLAVKQFSGSFTGVMALAVFSTLGSMGGYRLFVEPKVKRNRMMDVDACAEYLHEQEMQRKSKVNDTN